MLKIGKDNRGKEAQLNTRLNVLVGRRNKEDIENIEREG